MRLIQLATAPDEVLDLHPNVSVVVGLSDDARALLIDTVARLAHGQAIDAAGLLEAHGVLFDLDPELLDLIEGAPPEVDPVVEAGQLPAQPVSLDVRELRAREEAFSVLLELVRAQTEKRSAARDTLSAATTALERAHEARSEGIERHDWRTARAEGVATELGRLAEERGRIRAELEAARRDFDAARAAVAAQMPASGEAQADVGPAAEPELLVEPVALEPIDHEPVDDRTDHSLGSGTELTPEDEARVEELEHLLAVLVPRERALIEETLAQVAGTGTGALVPSPEAQRLADELDWLADQLDDGDGEAGDEPAIPSLSEAQRRLDDARQALLEAEQAVRAPELDRDDVLKLEDVHGELIEAIEKTDGRFGKTRAANRVAELRLAEQEVLDRLGFTSYSAYMMGYSLNDTDPAKEAALEAAREELSAAEDAWAALQDLSENELERAAAIEQRRLLYQHAAQLLGQEVTEPPQPALRALRIPAVSADDAASVLRAALDTVGVDLGDEELDHEDLTVLAEAWLAEADAAAERRRSVEAELAQIRAGGLASAPGPASADTAATLDVVSPEEVGEAFETATEEAMATPGEDAELEDWVARAEEAGARVARLEAEMAAIELEVAEAERAADELGDEVDVAELDRQLEAAKAVHAEAASAIEMIDHTIATLDAEGRAEAHEIERLQDIVAEQGTGSATPAEELEWYLLARLAALRSVSIAGSVPLLLDDALRGLGVEEACHLLTRLERMADVVQVIVLSDDPVVASWAATTGAARAAVVTPSAA